MTTISSTVVHRADIEFHEAADALRPFVGCFWIVTAEPGSTIRVVPDGSTAVAIQFTKGESAGWVLRGPMIRPDERRFESPAIMVGVRLRPGVSYLLSGIPAHATVGRRIDLRGVALCHDLVAAESSLRTPAQCIDVLQQFLIRRLEAARVDGIVAAAIDGIVREKGRVSVPAIAAGCGVSARHLNRLMRTWVGYGPKHFASIVRFQASLTQMERSPGRPAAALASEAGYFDQSHMTLDLTRFAGSTPGRLTSTCVADFSKTRCDSLP
jgi:methylphosphotriester-DNA--protein-cysteine methyltransferase